MTVMPKLIDATRLEAAWAERVLANREQAERLREGGPEGDFYAPVSSLFVADPRRTGEPALDAMRELTEPDETWIDVGAGAGRYALPLALRLKEVIAVEPSASMRHALRTGIAEHGITQHPDRRRGMARGGSNSWASCPAADIALIAHVGYDIEQIGPFLDALEAAVRDRCVAVLTDRSPASVADPFWPLVHGEERVALPALPELSRCSEPAAARWTCSGSSGRRGRSSRRRRSRRSSGASCSSRPGGAKDRSFKDALPRPHRGARRWLDPRRPPAGSIGIVSWEPAPPAGSSPVRLRSEAPPADARRANRTGPGVVSSPDITRPDRRTSRPSCNPRPSAPAGIADEQRPSVMIGPRHQGQSARAGAEEVRR